jgi:3-dehydroquinate synthase
VALGMIAEGQVAAEAGLCEGEDVERMTALLAGLGLPVTVRDVEPAQVVQACLVDKKRERGRLRVALPRGIGEAEVVDDVSPAALGRAVAQLLAGGR